MAETTKMLPNVGNSLSRESLWDPGLPIQTSKGQYYPRHVTGVKTIEAAIGVRNVFRGLERKFWLYTIMLLGDESKPQGIMRNSRKQA